MARLCNSPEKVSLLEPQFPHLSSEVISTCLLRAKGQDDSERPLKLAQLVWAFGKCWFLIMVVTGLSQVLRGGSEVWWKMAGIPFYSCRGWGWGWLDGWQRLPTSFPEPTVWTRAESPQLTVAGAVCVCKVSCRGVKDLSEGNWRAERFVCPLVE